MSDSKDLEATHKTESRLRILLRRVLAGGSILALTYVAIYVGIFMYREHRHAAERKRIDSVKLKVEYDHTKEYCPTGYPLLISVTNGADKVLKGVRFELEVYEEGNSSDLVDILDQDYHWNSILHPHHQLANCYRAPKLNSILAPSDKTLIFRVGELKYYNIDFYDEDEFIPLRQYDREPSH